MSTFGEATIAALIVTGVFLLFFTFRNEWVLRSRLTVLDGDGDDIDSMSAALVEYHRLPDYDTMLWRWWVWDVEKFKAPARERQNDEN